MQNAKENKIYLLGKNLSNSKSKVIHESIYRKLGLNFSYEFVELENADEVKEFFNEHKNNEFFAANVTYPYKSLCAEILKDYSLSQTAKFSGGTNLIISENKTLDNLDGKGCVNFLLKSGVEFKNNNIVICGTGVTAKSIFFEAAMYKPRDICFLSRNSSKKHIEGANIYDYSVQNKILPNADIVIDATPVSFCNSPVVNLDYVDVGSTVFDVCYGNSDTTLIKESKKRSIRSYDGKGMVLFQAILGIQKIFENMSDNNELLKDFEKLYNIAIEALDD